MKSKIIEARVDMVYSIGLTGIAPAIAGNMPSGNPGIAKPPRAKGPTIIPATICPTTPGRLRSLDSRPPPQVARRITAICKTTWVIRWVMECSSLPVSAVDEDVPVDPKTKRGTNTKSKKTMTICTKRF